MTRTSTDSAAPYGRASSGPRPLSRLEWATLIHLGIFVVGTTWGFGGGADWLRPILATWGTLGLVLTAIAIRDCNAWREGAMKPLLWLAPLAGLNALVLIGCLNPAFRELKFDTDFVLVPRLGISVWMPTSARRVDAMRALWLFDAIWISCFNLVLIIRQRRALRGLLILTTVNATVLAVFGTLQKLSHATGLYFDAVPSPQIYFFASFIYHNHWGAYTVLSLAGCLALVWHYARRIESRGFFDSPAFAGTVVGFLMAVTAPLSTSRSCSLLVLILLGGAFLHWVARLIQQGRRNGRGVLKPLGGALAAIALAAAGSWYLAQEAIVARIAKTSEQMSEILARGSLGSRAVLYADTWHMAKDRLWFGWGMDSYPRVFTLYNTQTSKDRLPVFYHDAHNDWLQSLAEHGFIGTILLVMCAGLPLFTVRRRHLSGPLPCYLLAGCALLVLYATMEFPFGNVAVVLVWWLSFFCAIHYARLLDRETGSTGKPPAVAP